MTSKPLQPLHQFAAILVGVRGLLLVVTDSQAAAQVEITDADALDPETAHQVLEALQGLHEGGHPGDLGADVAGHPQHLQMRQLHGPAVVIQGPLDIDAELILLESGGDIGMGAGVDVRIDPKGHRGLLLDETGDAVDLLQLLGGFHIEQQDAGLQGRPDLLGALAHPGIDDAPRFHPGRQGPAQFPAGDDVRPASQAGQQAQDGQVGVGLHREADDMGEAPEGGREHPEVVSQGGGAVKIKRGSHPGGDQAHRDVFTVEFAGLVVEVVHRSLSAQLSAINT